NAILLYFSDLYYGGEAFSVEQPQSFTCPYCGKMGCTETSLQEHVTSEHAETSTEVICPICAAGVRHVRRMFLPGRGLGGPRARRSNMHFTSSSTGGLSSSQSSYSPSNREAMDPIAELLSQLSGVRRSAGGQLNSSGPSASQLQQLQMQLSQQTLRSVPRQSMESERADRSLFVQELLLSTLVCEESSSSDEDDRGEMADFGAMGCVDIMPLDVALENLHLKESNKGNEPPPPPL
uniref:Potassium channel modulatory factor 1 n=1 Tax=Macaca nemestrina TaxID=9545 RepID=A0A2K6DTX3_MACNE